MLIDDIDIKKFGAKQLTVDISTSSITNKSEYNSKLLIPLFFDGEISFKTIEVSLLFKGSSRDEILKNISNLMSKLVKKVTLTLDGYTSRFDVVLQDSETVKSASEYTYKKNLTFIGYEYKKEVIETMNRITNKTINVVGNLETPSIVEITPSIDLINLTLTGLAEDPIILKNLKANKKLIVNGEDGTVTVDGVNKFSDTDMWGFPKLSPGAKTITVDKSSVDITIKYKPRYI